MERFNTIAKEIDAGLDTNDPDRIRVAMAEIDSCLNSTAMGELPILHYFRANAFSNLRKLRPDFQESQFSWQEPEYSEEILSLRRAIKCSNFADLNKIRQCQVFTNLGNALNTIGRPIEAIAAWDRALEIIPTFAMAAASRAKGLATYSAAFYDEGHQCVFLKLAAEGFRVALSPEAVWEGEYPKVVKDTFQSQHESIERYLAVKCNLGLFDPFNFKIGRNTEARKFNRWRLDQRLFLNPLNDLGAWPIAAQDIFHLPEHTYELANEAPRFVKYFDMLKQEYVTACVLLYEGLSQDAIHVADKSNLIFEHMDYSISNVGIEKQKMAFRMAYSLLDKCAVFINDYFELGHQPKSLDASFRKVWFADSKKRKLNSKLPLENWRLRGLYAISLDLFDPEINETSSPIAAKANEVRNAAEHRFVSVHTFGKPNDGPELCEYLTYDELSELALHVLRLSRASIMGLSLAVYHHEKYAKKKAGDSILVPYIAIPKNPNFSQ